MKFLTGLAAILFFASPTYAQIHFDREVGPFSKLKVTGRYEVTLEEGDEESLSFEVDGALEEDILVEQRNETLYIRLKLGMYSNADLKVKLTYKKLDAIEAWSGARLIMPDLIEQEEIRLEAQAGGEISADLAVEEATVLSSKGSQIVLVGTADFLEATSNTGGIIDAFKLKAEKVIAYAATGSETQVYAIKSIQGRATSGGIIEYEGSPKEKSIKVNLKGEARAR